MQTQTPIKSGQGQTNLALMQTSDWIQLSGMSGSQNSGPMHNAELELELDVPDLVSVDWDLWDQLISGPGNLRDDLTSYQSRSYNYDAQDDGYFFNNDRVQPPTTSPLTKDSDPILATEERGVFRSGTFFNLLGTVQLVAAFLC